jgi:hypothetical protein
MTDDPLNTPAQEVLLIRDKQGRFLPGTRPPLPHKGRLGGRALALRAMERGQPNHAGRCLPAGIYGRVPGGLGWRAAWTVLTDEMQHYEYKITANGSITYNAPSGYHDDCVIVLALANSKRYAFEGSGNIRIIQPAPKAARLRTRERALVG